MTDIAETTTANQPHFYPSRENILAAISAHNADLPAEQTEAVILAFGDKPFYTTPAEDEFRADVDKLCRHASRVPFQFCLVAFSEGEHWELEEEYTHFRRAGAPGGDSGEKLLADVETVFLFNKSSHTFCCEMTPSYFLEPLETREVLTEGAYEKYGDDPEFETWRDRLNAEILGNQSTFAENCEYRHVYQVDSYCQANPNRCYIGQPDTDPQTLWLTAEEAMEAAREGFQANCAL